jgi:predicted  nucleic acid-binding Zn-ribbon protein
MALLRRKSENPVAALERDLSDLLARRDVVEQKFDQAHAALAAATNEQRQALLDSDLDDATAAARRDGVVRDARDAIEAIGDALSEIGTKIVNAQSRLVAARDCVEREQVVRQATAEYAQQWSDTRSQGDWGGQREPMRRIGVLMLYPESD